jgi:hypothetical protein
VFKLPNGGGHLEDIRVVSFATGLLTGVLLVLLEVENACEEENEEDHGEYGLVEHELDADARAQLSEGGLVHRKREFTHLPFLVATGTPFSPRPSPHALRLFVQQAQPQIRRHFKRVVTLRYRFSLSTRLH